MFKTLQRKLTLTYSIWFFLTLAVIFVILFFVFRNMIYQSVSWQVDDIAGDQASEYAHTQKLEGGVFKHSLHLFAFLANNGNDVVYRGALPDDLRRSMIQKIAKRQKTGLIEAVTPHGEKSLIIYAMEPVEKDGRQLGYILVGKEINRTHEQIEGWFRLLFVLSLGAACLSVIIAHFLARRAVLPVKRNYEKQRAFVADASHEMRTPLSVFSASLEFFEAEEKERLSESSQETLKDLKDEVSEMNTLISHLLALARADRGALASKRSDFPLGRLTRPMIPYYKQKADRAQKRFSYTLPSKTVFLNANPTEIKQLLTIFLDNALKYTQKGGLVTLKISTDEKRRLLCFSVEDTGIGIPEEDQKHIFERFYRVEKGRTRQSGGSGLGLSIAREIITAYSGQIDLKSMPGKGTTFQVILPILKAFD
ncbi:HAMP domain-containing sensor histidine kinase [Sporolactobacillus sp. CQH2019]|uniref:sensor histidine kinase n=1 Tax=Sporolactobacillus sp. CQH2019 TaxID=3023512 RepID=UPI0023689582|nr:HAMP domain-containing sensor histidine kinase [Sporolactobacillus sp. CQH2019]MDD9146985.1 HAMP domain-containing sensor histidine kinase [Sporolactobacillus sp. CQH2019]